MGPPTSLAGVSMQATLGLLAGAATMVVINTRLPLFRIVLVCV